MSAVAALCAGASGTAPPESRVHAMLRAMRGRGEAVHLSASRGDATPRAVLGAARHAWESPTGSTPEICVAVRGARTLVADATLYHVADLVRALDAAGARPAHTSAASLILAAVEAEGEAGIARLEGDFAFILHDARTGAVLAGRDFAGRRSLHHALVGDTLLIATAPEGLLADPAVPAALDLATLATTAAGLWSHAPQTVHASILELPAGHLLHWRPGEAVRTSSFWSPPEGLLSRRQPLETAAEELRHLLRAAVRERLDPDGPTAVSLSGGWDSTAVFASAHEVLRTAPRSGRACRAVSISYPVGDPGREDDLIRSVLDHWATTTEWIQVDDVPLFRDARAAAAARPGPFAHAYEHWNRALYQGARRVGARVMLDGVGGDQLFQVSDIYMADLFARGQWLELARQWRARRGRGLRNLYRWAIRPALPEAVPRWLARLRGTSPPRHHFHRDAPFWFSRRFLDAHGVMDRELGAAPTLPRRSMVLNEGHAYLRFPFFPRILGVLHAFGQEEGVEVRSPLMDARVVDWALRRPWSERADGAETKLALRAAMRGSLPDHVLAPRAHRTGITSAYFLRQLRGAGRPLFEDMLADSHLATLGMIDLRLLRRAWDHVLRHDDDETGARLFFTLEAELWLRAHGGSGAPAS